MVVAEGASARTTKFLSGRSNLRVVLAHEWLVRYAGSERCVHELIKVFPGARLLTTVARPDQLPQPLRGAETSWLQHVPGAAAHHQWFIPLMPLAWRLREPIDDVDVVISSSHACAKGVRVAQGIPHLCYCHTPMRYAWDFTSEQLRFPPIVRPAAKAIMGSLRRWDRKAADGVTCFVANSNAVAERIRRVYDRHAVVVHPPVRTDFFTPDAERSDFFLLAGRLVAYKRPDLVIDAFAGLPNHELVVAGSGPMLNELRARATPNVRFVVDADDVELRVLYRAAQGLVHAGEEDFGIAMAEAQACGTPVIAMGRGGALDIVIENETGLFIEAMTAEAVRAAVLTAAGISWNVDVIATSARRFRSDRFASEMSGIVSSLLAT